MIQKCIRKAKIQPFNSRFLHGQTKLGVELKQSFFIYTVNGCDAMVQCMFQLKHSSVEVTFG